ncbi:MAG: 4-hydroxythreonine-4-phosphate dehydrogenase, partial [Rhodobacterales bacterium]|nr:4-hydroxythreonine-4-phosphate dehydrogenase [Rhodobacterales bacterium]
MGVPLAITPGDPRGVGPEVTCKALALRSQRGQPVHAVLLGHRAALVRAAELVDFDLRSVDVIDLGDEDEPIEVASIRAAVLGIQEGRFGALVTGPIHKARLAARGFQYPGHTDFLGHLCGVERPVMAFVGGSVRVVLVTVHLPLSQVAAAVTHEAVLDTIQAANRALQAQLGIERPKLLVCGLNPHAGDVG